VQYTLADTDVYDCLKDMYFGRKIQLLPPSRRNKSAENPSCDSHSSGRRARVSSNRAVGLAVVFDVVRVDADVVYDVVGVFYLFALGNVNRNSILNA